MDLNLSFAPTAEFSRARTGITDPHARATAWSALSRINALYMIMRAGSGHIGSSFSAADIVSWLLLEEMDRPFADDGDLYFSSKGHDVPGLYAALTGAGLLAESELHTFRRLGGLPGHPDVRTPHMPFCTGSLGMGISKAKGLILGNRLNAARQRVYVLTGDGELQEGQNWEALRGAVHEDMAELTVIVDHNKLQSDTWVTDVNDLGDLTGRFTTSGWGALRCDGHDFAQLERTLARRWAEFPDRPAVIVADTVKGAGATVFDATSMAPGAWRYLHHSGAPSPENYDAALAELRGRVDALFADAGLAPLALRDETVTRAPLATGPTLPAVYGEALTELAAEDPRVVALDADLVLDTGLIPFREAHPDRFVECGIAEQDMVSMAGGLARQGHLPFAHSFSCFLHSRPNEQIYNNATEGRKVVYVGSLAGLVPGAPGHSHQAVRDVSALGGVPGLVVLEPAGPAQARAAVRFCADTDLSVFLRLVSVPCSPESTALPDEPLVLGRGNVVREGGPIALVTAGPVTLTESLRAAARLAEDVPVTVINLPWLNRVDPDWLAEAIAGTDHLVVVENHLAHGGQADMLARALIDLAAQGTRIPAMRRIGPGRDEIPVCGTPEEVLRAHGLHADQLVEAVAALAGVTPPPVPAGAGLDLAHQASPQ